MRPAHRRGPGPRRGRLRPGRRTVRVPAAVRPAVLAAVGGRAAGPLFADAGGRRLARENLCRPWRRFLAGLGLPYRPFHALRHSSITHQLAAGYAAADVAKYHGNTAKVVLAVYAHPTGRDPSEAADAILGAVRCAKRGRAGGKTA